MHDLLIRAGRVVDGTGASARRTDVPIQGDRIAAIGDNLGTARDTLDARSLVVAPGFIDPHTHLRRPVVPLTSSHLSSGL